MFHVPVEGLFYIVEAIVKLWREAFAPTDSCSDPVVARRKRFWKRVQATVVTLFFSLMFGGMICLLMRACSSYEPPTPEEILWKRGQWPPRAVPSQAPKPTNAPPGETTVPAQP